MKAILGILAAGVGLVMLFQAVQSPEDHARWTAQVDQIERQVLRDR